MAKRSAGILVWRRRGGGIELLLVHPGGPFWAKRDAGAWSIPKGEFGADEPPQDAARREFGEETGWRLDAALVPLGEVRQKAGKIVTGFAAEADFDVATLAANAFEMEWPPRSGRRIAVPEVDRAAWFTPDEARSKLVEGQRALVDRLEAMLRGAAPGP